MPVHFKGNSEYKRNYSWLDSFKSGSFEPSLEQVAPMAGLSSAQLSTIQQEPPIQHKKRIEGPSATLSTDYYEEKARRNQDEYILLGNQEKFTENVRYHCRNGSNGRDVSPPKQPKLQGKRTQKSPARDKSVKENKNVTSVPIVDTSEFSIPRTPLAPRKPKDQSSSVIQAAKHSLKEKNDNLDSSDFAPKVGLKDKKIVDNMNEFVQTDMAKGVADSAPEAPAEYALKYKAGISAPRPTKKFSEYQKQFTWKDRIPSSPLLAAEQVVYNSSSSVAPFKKDVLPKTSEYRAQFKSWDDAQDMMDREDKESEKVAPSKKTGKTKNDQEKMDTGEVEKKQKLGNPERQKRTKEVQNGQMKTKTLKKRSQSADVVQRKKLPEKTKTMVPAAGSEALIPSDNKRLTKESDSLEPPKPVPKIIQGGKMKRVRSEYLSNFQPPWMYDYKDGAWRGANPPHLQSTQGQINEKTEQPHSNWFAEVVELRQKAEEYRRRAQGTHFSREHLVQLLAKQTEMWDVESVKSGVSTLSALSLESGASIIEKKDQKLIEEKVFRDSDSTKATIATEDTHSRTPSPDSDDKIPQKRNIVPQQIKKSKFQRKASPATKKIIRKGERRRYQAPLRPRLQQEEEDIIETPSQLSGDEEERYEDIPVIKQSNNIPMSRKLAWMDKGSQTVNKKTYNVDEGRVPTPTLKSYPETSKRHHLDRTTPAVGGALLTSPPSVKKTFSYRQQPVSQSVPAMYSDEAYDSDSDDTLEAEPVRTRGRSQFKKTNNQQGVSRLALSPTFGMPSRDSHFLRDDSVSEDKFLLTRFIDHPKAPVEEEDDFTVAEKKSYPRERKSRLNAGLDIPSTLKEGIGQTYNLQKPSQGKTQLPLTKSNLAWTIDGGMPVPRVDRDDDDDDVLSTSARSIASSCSLASETLERARKRRDDFWMKSGLATR